MPQQSSQGYGSVETSIQGLLLLLLLLLQLLLLPLVSSQSHDTELISLGDDVPKWVYLYQQTTTKSTGHQLSVVYRSNMLLMYLPILEGSGCGPAISGGDTVPAGNNRL